MLRLAAHPQAALRALTAWLASVRPRSHTAPSEWAARTTSSTASHRRRRPRSPRSGGRSLITGMPWPATWARIRWRANSGISRISWQNRPGLASLHQRIGRAQLQALGLQSLGGPNSIASHHALAAHVPSTSSRCRTSARRQAPASSASPSVAARATVLARLEHRRASAEPGRLAELALSRRSSRARTALVHAVEHPIEDRRARIATAPTGAKPPESALASSIMSGSTPQCSQARNAAGAADTGLDLVGYQQVPCRRQSRAPRAGSRSSGRMDAVALDRLDR